VFLAGVLRPVSYICCVKGMGVSLGHSVVDALCREAMMRTYINNKAGLDQESGGREGRQGGRREPLDFFLYALGSVSST
jgi:hypothetical protein